MPVSNRLATSLLVVLTSVMPVAAQEAEMLPTDDIVKVEVHLVTVNVSVTDSGNRPVAGLRAEHFVVSDEGRQVGLEFFDDRGPSSIVFVVDASGSMKPEKWKKLREGLKKFLARAREGNDYSLVSFGDQARLVAEGVSAEALWESFNGLDPAGDTALYDAMLVGLGALERTPRRHKALVLLSDGQDNSSRATLEVVRREALARRATIYTVGIIRGSKYFDPQLLKEEHEGKKLLDRLAAATGGLSFFPKPYDLGKVLGGINDDISSQYTLGYYAPDEGPGWRNVSVSVNARPPRPVRLRYQQLYLKR